MIARKATDLYLTVGVPPTLRIEDQLHPVGDVMLTEEDIQNILAEVLTSRQRREYDINLEMNLAFDMGRDGRFRINVLRQRQHSALVVRRITSKIPTFEDLRLPPLIEKLSMEKRGLILISGVTSSGKSTTLASMVDHRNGTLGGHIITIEDPIEYYHEHRKGIVTQREVGIDTSGFGVALKNALRQKPDVIMVGEIRDFEVMEQALTAAETGHLCLSTIHTSNASQTIERIINMFPEERQQQVRISLSINLRAIVAQRLVPSVSGGLVLAVEILLNEALIRELILKGDTNKMREVMANNSVAGMMTFDQSLLRLYAEGLISDETAIIEADIPADMKMRIQQLKLSGKMDEAAKIDTSVLSL